MEGDDSDNSDDSDDDLSVVGFDAPSVHADSARAADVRKYYANQPLHAASLQSAVLLSCPTAVPALLGSKCTRRGLLRQQVGARRAARQLGRRGFCVVDAGLAAEVTSRAAAQASAIPLAPGGFVRNGQRLPQTLAGDACHQSPPTRGDLTCTLGTPSSPAGAQTDALATIDAAMHQFGRSLLEALDAASQDPEEGVGPLGSGPDGEVLQYASRSKMQIACYPGGGARYLPHIDNGDGDGRTHDFGRVLTIVYYLSDMEAADGGALRLHLLPEVAQREPALIAAVGAAHTGEFTAAVDVLPRAGLMVAFRADRLVHEVRPVHGRTRYALTVWMLARAKLW